MPSSDRPRRFGRLTIDRDRIAQRRILGLFGRAFSLAWPAITGWAIAEMRRVDPRTGEERVVSRTLELHTQTGIEFVTRAPDDAAFEGIVAAVQHHLPDKRTQSRLETLSVVRNSPASGAPDR